jgi:hypothetical protein
MKAVETTGTFNDKGELDIDSLPAIKNQKVRLLILFEEEQQEDWYQLSAQGLSGAYGEDEPTYTLDMLKESNTAYKP